MSDKPNKPTIMQSGALPDYVQNPLDWAIMQGWKSIPLVPNKKIPCEADPFGTATNDPEKIKEWFPRYPGCGFGITTGASNGITVLDLDIKNGINGLENFNA